MLAHKAGSAGTRCSPLAELRPAVRTFWTAGNSSPISIAIMAMTTRLLAASHPSDGEDDHEGVGAISFARIRGFTIVDNGVGFDSANFASFETMDSRAKATLGGKGVGRLLWLLAFERARIVSIYEKAASGGGGSSSSSRRSRGSSSSP